MTEKYKIYCSKSLKNSLLHDAELFEFYKKDGMINLNSFLKVLLVNYYPIYKEREESKINEIHLLLSKHIKDKNKVDLLTKELMDGLDTNQNKEEINEETITFTVSNLSYQLIQMIQNHDLKNVSLSQYLRDLFKSYLSMPRKNRERIIFQDEYETIQKAISSNKCIAFKNFTFAPYRITSTKDELFNYVLGYDLDTKKVRSFRLSRMECVFILKEEVQFNDDIIEKLEQAISKGAQFSFQEKILFKVQLSDEGKRRFKMIYTNRPEVSKIEKDIYSFNWPLSPFIEYFKRFGKEAIIIEPEYVKDIMVQYYQEAFDAYKK